MKIGCESEISDDSVKGEMYFNTPYHSKKLCPYNKSSVEYSCTKSEKKLLVIAMLPWSNSLPYHTVQINIHNEVKQEKAMHHHHTPLVGPVTLPLEELCELKS